MIVLNKLAKGCRENAIASGRVTPTSNPRVFFMQLSRVLNKAYEATNFPSIELPQWNEKEVAMADVVCWALAAMQQLGCVNPEQVVRDLANHRSLHPDIPPKRHD